MNLEAIQKAYSALEKDGIIKHHLGPFSVEEFPVGGGIIRFSSARNETLINVLVQELDFHSFRVWTSMYIGTHIKPPFFKPGHEILSEGVCLFNELTDTAKCFI